MWLLVVDFSSFPLFVLHETDFINSLTCYKLNKTDPVSTDAVSESNTTATSRGYPEPGKAEQIWHGRMSCLTATTLSLANGNVSRKTDV